MIEWLDRINEVLIWILDGVFIEYFPITLTVLMAGCLLFFVVLIWLH